MNIATIIGARPQFIKAALISEKINTIDSLSEIIIHTGQHFDKKMSKIFFDEMNIPQPNYNLNNKRLQKFHIDNIISFLARKRLPQLGHFERRDIYSVHLFLFQE